MSGHCQRADFWQPKHIDRATPYATLTQNVTRFVGGNTVVYHGIIIAFFVLFYTFPIFSERPKVLDYFPENGGAACGVIIIFDGYTHVVTRSVAMRDTLCNNCAFYFFNNPNATILRSHFSTRILSFEKKRVATISDITRKFKYKCWKILRCTLSKNNTRKILIIPFLEHFTMVYFKNVL